jgi:phage terminase large subunit
MSAAPDGGGGVTDWAFKPLDWQEGFIYDEHDEVLGSGAFGAGKTRALCEKAYLNLTNYPGNRGLLTRKTFASITNTTLTVLLEEVIPDAYIVAHNQGRHVIYVQSPYYPTIYCRDCDWQSTRILPLNKRDRLRNDSRCVCPDCGDRTVEFTPPSELYYEGLNTGSRPGEMPEKIAGMNLGFVGVDEGIEVTEKDWEMLQGRLRLTHLNNPWQPELPTRQIFSATNPAGPNHWLYRRFYEQGVGAVYEGSAADNVHNPDDYLPRLRAQFAGTDAERYIGGEWVGYEGLIYDEFSESIHALEPLDAVDMLPGEWHIPDSTVTDLQAMRAERGVQTGDPDDAEAYVPARLYPPADMDIVMSIDWGYRPDPLVVQWWADTDEYGYVLYREYVKTRTLPDDAAVEALGEMAAYEVPNVRAVYADHDSGDRAAWLEGARSLIEADPDLDDGDWRRFRTTTARKDVADGIQTVKRLLRPDEHDRAGLYFVNGARCHRKDTHLATESKPGDILGEIRGYVWQDDARDEPQTHDNHSADAMRYMAHTDRHTATTSGPMVSKS